MSNEPDWALERALQIVMRMYGIDERTAALVGDRYQPQIDILAAELRKERAEVARLREALKPFSAYVENGPIHPHDSSGFALLRFGKHSITVGDCRKAQEVLGA